MTFGLRNVGATFQRCMQKCLLKQLGRNTHVYVDDVVVKTEKRETLLEDLRETFENLRRFQIKLNPEKCVFGVPAGQLLGFLVSECGIECNPVKIKAIERMEVPDRLLDVQKFTGCLASISRFISRLGEKALPLYQLMKKTTFFEWNHKADEAFFQLKKMLTTLPVLAAPTPKEPMLLYIAATSRVVSTVIVVERKEEGKALPVQRPVYYLSEVLSTSKQNYPHYQKMCYSVHFATKKLKPYFQEHPITVVCTAPLAEIIGSRDASGRVAKWAIELAPYTIYYQPRTAIKSQALADFLVDWAETQYLPPAPDSTHWRMHFDGSKMRTGLGAGVVLSSPEGNKLKYTLQIHFAASNNIAEYEALIHGLRLAKELGIRRILCYGDSDLVVQQSSGEWDAKDANMASYRFLVQQLSGYFEGCEFLHVLRNDNDQADTLARIGSTRQAIPSDVALQRLLKPSVKPSPESDSIFVPAPPEEAGSDSRAPADGTDFRTRPRNCGDQPKNFRTWPRGCASQPGDFINPASGCRLQPAASQPSRPRPSCSFDNRRNSSTLMELVRCSVTGVYQRCVETEQGQAILKDIHQGECGHHAASRALVTKAFRHGFFWPIALEEAKELVQKCKGCQKFRSKPHQPASALKTIPIAWPFVVWGLDMGIRLDLESISHPQSNGQVERANGLILSGIKPRLVEPLERSAGCWLDELPAILWSLRTTPNKSTGFTPFFLVYGAEAVIPMDIEFDSPRVTMYTEEEAEEARQDSVDLLEEGRLLALSRSSIYQQSLRRYYKKKVRARSFQEGDLVLRLIQ
ncbi:unnamed protein product [Triticum aestivum]|uniref:RNase H type-1 domain-containing protein n=1 Tax=Triticum aestivum TaxID=4565 RepID=A0A7H4LND0_WHEAT|nr:unnamed protein product [Triticum aestivum]